MEALIIVIEHCKNKNLCNKFVTISVTGEYECFLYAENEREMNDVFTDAWSSRGKGEIQEIG